MNHHHPRQIASNNPEQDSSLPHSASTADNPFKISLPASRCGVSLAKMTTPNSPDRYYFSSHSPARVLPPLPPPHTLRHSVSDLIHSPAKTSSGSSTSSQDFHFSTDLDTADSKGLSRMKDRLRETCKIPPLCCTVSDVYATTDQPFGSMPNLQPAPFVPARATPVVPDRATGYPTFLISLMAVYLALSLYPQSKVEMTHWTRVEIFTGILISMGMEGTCYILINWVADKPYPLLSWLALIIGKIIFWTSQFQNLPFRVYLPVLTVLNAFLVGSLAAKITLNIGWGVACQFLRDNLGILDPF